ncbi:MAG: thioredoxin family protein [Bacteroidales bacterium]
MKKMLIVLVLMALIPAAVAQKKAKVVTDPKNQKPMLVGKCTRKALEKDPFKEWFEKEYNSYQVDSKTLDGLKNQWKDIHIVLVMGTWCGDSRREVPRFYKILDYVKFKRKRLTVICVDRDKKACGIDVAQYNVQYVPTIIVYRGKAEMGRIIENPSETLEKDLFKYVGLAEGF